MRFFAQSTMMPGLMKALEISSVPALAMGLGLLLGCSEQTGDPAAGKATFISICSSCHGMDGIATLDYAPSFSKCQRLDQDDAKLLVSVRDGVGGRMPPWGVYLSEGQIRDAIAYARTFCKGRADNSLQNPAQH